MFRGSVKGAGYPLHSPVSPSLPLPCVTVCHHISTGVYLLLSAGQKDKWAEPGNLRTGAYFQFSFFFIKGSSDLLFIRDSEFNLTRLAAQICAPWQTVPQKRTGPELLNKEIWGEGGVGVVHRDQSCADRWRTCWTHLTDYLKYSSNTAVIT
jgi:hypothetical protein